MNTRINYTGDPGIFYGDLDIPAFFIRQDTYDAKKTDKAVFFKLKDGQCIKINTGEIPIFSDNCIVIQVEPVRTLEFKICR